MINTGSQIGVDMRTSSRLANDAWEALLTAHAVLIKKLAEEDVWTDVTMREYDVLLSQPALSRMVDRLVERGLVQRTPDPADGRSVRLSLTSTGRERQRVTGGRHAIGVAQTVGDALSEAELRELERLCGKLAYAAQTDGNPHHKITNSQTTNGKITKTEDLAL